jgi:hypothetical protein
MPFKRIERPAFKPMVVIVRSDEILVDAQFLHSDAREPIERLGVSMREILRMVSRVGRDVLPEGDANGLAGKETAKRIAHPLNVAWVPTEIK